MTNGEKMQEMFPEGKTRKCRDGVVFESDGWCHAYDSDWWNAEYKEPTPKKDLAVAESISMDVLNNAIDHVEDYVCNHVKDHAKAQGMCDALTMIEEYIKEQNIEKNN